VGVRSGENAVEEEKSNCCGNSDLPTLQKKYLNGPLGIVIFLQHFQEYFLPYPKFHADNLFVYRADFGVSGDEVLGVSEANKLFVFDPALDPADSFVGRGTVFPDVVGILVVPVIFHHAGDVVGKFFDFRYGVVAGFEIDSFSVDVFGGGPIVDYGGNDSLRVHGSLYRQKECPMPIIIPAIRMEPSTMHKSTTSQFGIKPASLNHHGST
jgi:hypothetical protein